MNLHISIYVQCSICTMAVSNRYYPFAVCVCVSICVWVLFCVSFLKTNCKLFDTLSPSSSSLLFVVYVLLNYVNCTSICIFYNNNNKLLIKFLQLPPVMDGCLANRAIFMIYPSFFWRAATTISCTFSIFENSFGVDIVH